MKGYFREIPVPCSPRTEGATLSGRTCLRAEPQRPRQGGEGLEQRAAPLRL